MPTKPTLTIAKRLFRRRNPGVKGLRAEWFVKPYQHNGAWYGVVRFNAPGYARMRQTICADSGETAIY